MVELMRIELVTLSYYIYLDNSLFEFHPLAIFTLERSSRRKITRGLTVEKRHRFVLSEVLTL